MGNLTIEKLFKSGGHFGHKIKKYNPKMKPYIFKKTNDFHIIDLARTMPLLDKAYSFLYNQVKKGSKLLFVGTKLQAQGIIKEVATETNSFYVVTRWLGGTLTNLPVIRKSINKLQKLQSMKEDGLLEGLKKKEISRHNRDIEKLQKFLSGIEDMSVIPDVVIISDIVREKIALAEANKLNIPVVALVDTNSNPELVNYPIPVNDDSTRTLNLIFEKLKQIIIPAKNEFDLQKRREEQKEAEARAKIVQKKRLEKSKKTKDNLEEKKDTKVKNDSVIKEKKELEKKEPIIKNKESKEKNIKKEDKK